MKSIGTASIERVYQQSFQSDQLKSAVYARVVPRFRAVGTVREGRLEAFRSAQGGG
jgi:hypothetical protein